MDRWPKPLEELILYLQKEQSKGGGAIQRGAVVEQTQRKRL
jgi:hypothetical protein